MWRFSVIMQILPREVISPESVSMNLVKKKKKKKYVVFLLNWNPIDSSDYKPSQKHWNEFWFIMTFWSLKHQ